MKSFLKILISSVGAGVSIGIGATAYVCCPNVVIGSFLFSVGLFTVIYKQFDLYTGKLFTKINPFELLLIFVGNSIGTGIVAKLVMFSRIYTEDFANRINLILNTKVSDDPISLTCLSILCGALMYIAITNYRKSNKTLSVILPIMAFILCGFEHSVANMYYFGFGNFDLITIIIVVLGNYVGGNLLRLIDNEKI